MMSVDSHPASAAAAWRWWALAISVTAADQFTKLAISTLMFYGRLSPASC